MDEEDEIRYSEEVMQLLNSEFPSTDPLEQADFDVVDYINTLFPNEQSLANIDEVVADVECKLFTIDDEIRHAVHNQSIAVQDGEEALEEAKLTIQQLFLKIKGIKERAEQSEDTVKEITRDIKQLDIAKRNLTASITTHNHLHMLTGGVETLTTLSNKCQFGEAASLLQGVLNVMEHFVTYKSVPTIKELSKKVDEIKQNLTQQVYKEFDDVFTNTGSSKATFNFKQLNEACLVAEALGGKVKNEVINKVVRNQLAEYSVLFEPTQDVAWLNKIDRRYAWIKRTLLEFEERLSSIFPESWEVSERIAVQFCHTTNCELNKIMQHRINAIDVKLLLYAIQKTTGFEQLLSTRLTGATLTEDKPKEDNSDDDINESNPFYEEVIKEKKAKKEADEPKLSDKTEKANSFQGLISKCFENYLHIYIESQDRNLADLMNKFQQDFLEQQAQSKHAPAGSIGQSEVLPTCADLFVYYKKCMLQCSQLSTGDPMIQLANLFKKYLREYAQKLLGNNLPKSVPSSTQQSLASSNISFTTVTNLLKETTSNLKEGNAENHRLNGHEIRLCCTILCTADYCLETTHQLEEKLKQKVNSDLCNKIDLEQERNVFTTIISNSIRILVNDLIAACEPAFYVMSKFSWISLEQVGDQSSYVTSITSNIKQTVPLLRDHLVSARKYFTQYCIKFVNNFIPHFISSLYKCKPMGTVGTEQLLLDTHSLKTVLLDMPSIGSQVNRKAPASFTKIVVKGMTRAEMLLKVVMYPQDPAQAFVANFIQLLSVSEGEAFQKVLDMKGLKRSEQTVLLDIFRKQQPASESNTNKVLSRHSDSTSLTGIKKLEKLIKEKL